MSQNLSHFIYNVFDYARIYWTFLKTPSTLGVINWACIIVLAIFGLCMLGKYIIDNVYADTPLSNDDNYFI